MIAQDNKTLVRRYVEEVFNQRRLGAVETFLAPDHVDHTLPKGLPTDLAGTKRAIALPDSGATRAVVRDVSRVNASVPILARIAREEDEETPKRLGVTQVIAPERAGAQLLLE